MKRILHVLSSTPFGGMQLVATALAAEQRTLGFDASILGIYQNQHLLERANQLNVPINFVGDLRPSISSVVQLTQAIRRQEPDIVHLHGMLFWTLATALMIKRQPWFLHAHSYPGTLDLKEKMNWAMTRRLCDGVFCGSQSVLHEIAPLVGRLRCMTISNGTKIPSLLPKAAPDPKCPVFGIAMRLTHDKGIGLVVDLAAALSQHCPSAKLLVAGTGEAKAHLASSLHTRGLSAMVELLGHVSDMEEFWRRLDLSFFVSPRDTFGLTIIESFGHGVPVIAFHTGCGSDEVFSAVGTDFLVPKADPAEMVSRALDLVRNTNAYAAVRVLAHDVMNEHYSIRAFANRVCRGYSELSSS